MTSTYVLHGLHILREERERETEAETERQKETQRDTETKKKKIDSQIRSSA